MLGQVVRHTKMPFHDFDNPNWKAKLLSVIDPGLLVALLFLVQEILQVVDLVLDLTLG